jgi:hypothetical protein
MKIVFSLVCTLLILSGCNQSSERITALQTKIDGLENRIKQTYKPGFGEFMSSIQVHHEKLWFSGQYQNWELAEFESNEIKEALDGIKSYCTDRPEAQSLNLIDPAMDSIDNAIKQNNSIAFKNSFTLLTATCNNCHQTTNHAFNVIKVPETPPFSNQEFKKF